MNSVYLRGGGYWCSLPHGCACHGYYPLPLPFFVSGVGFLVLHRMALSGRGSAIVCRDKDFFLGVKYVVAFNPGRVLEKYDGHVESAI